MCDTFAIGNRVLYVGDTESFIGKTGVIIGADPLGRSEVLQVKFDEAITHRGWTDDQWKVFTKNLALESDSPVPIQYSFDSFIQGGISDE